MGCELGERPILGRQSCGDTPVDNAPSQTYCDHLVTTETVGYQVGPRSSSTPSKTTEPSFPSWPTMAIPGTSLPVVITIR